MLGRQYEESASTATRTIDVKLSAGDTFFWAVYSVGTDKFSIYQDYSYISGYLIG